LSESQEITLRNALGERADHTWAATRVADFGPRQGTGKNDKIAARELAGLVLFGEKLIIHTAHEFPTANESFLRLVSVFENWDDLRSRVARIRYANGEQGIEFLTGQRIKYRARTGGSGRGFAKADLLVYDEAQHLAREHIAASGPTKLANPNSQTWYAGSGGLESSQVAWKIRRDALSGDAGRLAYTEMTAEAVSLHLGRVESASPPDPSDREVWYRTIPGLGNWVTEEGVEALYDELGPELFMREILCVWDAELGTDERLISGPAWDMVNEPAVAPTGRIAFGVDVHEERRSASIVAASEHKEVELVDHRDGIDWVVPRVIELCTKWDTLCAFDVSGPAGSLAHELGKLGRRLAPVSGADMPKACASFFDDVAESRLRVKRDRALDKAVAGARRRFVGDAWKWTRRDSSVDITPLVAATVGLWSIGTRPPRSVLDNVW
jgi:hypothetical protein